MNRIALVIPYFGTFNNYFDFWIKSASYNPKVDFIILTDNDRTNSGGVNIKFVNIAFTEVEALIKSKMKPYIKEDIVLESPYKLCDYKPLYGFIFSDYLANYEFWGHCDVDLIFGSISKFVTDDILDRYDRIYSRGHLSIYRNDKELNMFFLKSDDNTVECPSYQRVFTCADSFAFDEWGGLSRIWQQLYSDRMYNEIDFDDINIAYKHFISSQKHKSIDVGRTNIIFEFDNGKLYRWFIESGMVRKMETCYAHFQKRDFSVTVDSTDHYLIIPNKFIPFEPVSVSILKKYGHKYLFYSKYYKIRYNNLKRKIRKIFQKCQNYFK